MDCVRAGNTGIHGYGRETSPNMSTLSDQCITFLNAKSPNAKSLTSHVSMFTGLHVEDHGVTSTERRLDPQATIWGELAGEHGYDTGVFSGNTFLTQLDTGLSSSFDHVFSGSELRFESGLDPANYYSEGNLEYKRFAIDSIRDLSTIRSFLNGVTKLRSDRDAHKYASEFLEWRDSVDGPWAAYINFMDAHTKYQPPGEFDEWASDEAARTMAEIDDAVYDHLEELGYA